MVTAQEVARHYQVTSATVYNWVKKGLPHELTGGINRVMRFNLQDVDKWIQENRKED